MSFPTTRWTLLADATLNGDTAGREALANLCHAYRRPVLAFLKASGLPLEDAEDLTQAFLLKLVESRLWKRADRLKGRFRNFLLGTLRHVMDHHLRSQQALKRGRGVAPLSLEDFDDSSPEMMDDQSTSDSLFDREWALSLVDSTLKAVQAEFLARDQQREFELLRFYLPGTGVPPAYEEAAASLGLSLSALKAAIHRLRQRFRELLRQAVSVTVSAPHEVDEELRYLAKLLINHPEPGNSGPPNGNG